MNVKINFYTILILNCFLSAFSQVLLKKASQKEYKAFWQQYLNVFVILGYSIFLLVVLINIFILRVLPISIANPIEEALPVALSFFSGKFIFAEAFGIRKIIGSLIILIGMIIILI